VFILVERKEKRLPEKTKSIPEKSYVDDTHNRAKHIHVQNTESNEIEQSIF
jgi:hypothetical protein